jgi:hypothetical protein
MYCPDNGAQCTPLVSPGGHCELVYIFFIPANNNNNKKKLIKIHDVFSKEMMNVLAKNLFV